MSFSINLQFPSTRINSYILPPIILFGSILLPYPSPSLRDVNVSDISPNWVHESIIILDLEPFFFLLPNGVQGYCDLFRPAPYFDFVYQKIPCFCESAHFSNFAGVYISEEIRFEMHNSFFTCKILTVMNGKCTNCDAIISVL